MSIVGISEAATTASPAATESGPPDRRGEDQRRPVPEVPGVGDRGRRSGPAAVPSARGRARPWPARRPRSRRGSAPRRRASGPARRRRGRASPASKAKRRRRSPRRRPSRSRPRSRAGSGPRRAAPARRRAPAPRRGRRSRSRRRPAASSVSWMPSRKRADEDQRQRDPERRPHRVAAAAPEPGDEQDQGRPDDVELLLDRQRPEVQDGARFGALGEVVDRLGGEVPVGDVEGGADDVPGDFDRAQRREEDEREDADRGQQDRRERQQAFGPAGVEAAQRDRPGAVQLAAAAGG